MANSRTLNRKLPNHLKKNKMTLPRKLDSGEQNSVEEAIRGKL